ncbi:benzoate--CoA ligase [Prauserella marina]|uniref:Benzoate-CoA ligase n=1 Tax=Prauserella marina TaxID=530584 RepID=A0A222VL01_9PSEU|nr:benzoate-CoA ligase family protein [Prauserella marina]ASR34606.1 benzoate--CoA ligase [Prauserella marina]PWV85759.1 benzoate-CoA ligase [Prauserella marina]SDC46308.1 benzoate-CoA ligase [Prauserella marina]
MSIPGGTFPFNAAEYLVGRHVASGDGARTAVVSNTRTLTYSELDQQVRTVAAGLRALGVRPEERVLMCMTDEIELFTAILAGMYLGAVAVPCSTMLTGGELGRLIADSRTRIVLGSTEFAEQVRAGVAVAPDVETVVLTDEWHRLTGQGALSTPYDTWADSPALWLYTSGTTGAPKAAMHRHTDIRFVAENYAQRVLGIRPDDRCLSVAKLFFAYGIGNSMFFPLSVGATALLESARPTPALMAERASTQNATLLFGTPSFWGPLLASDVPGDAFRTVRGGASAGEALPPRMLHGMRERFGVEVLDGIGSTEMLHIFISNRPGKARPSSSGTPVPGYEVEIRDESGALIETDGQPGELYVRGDSAATGYWCRAATSRLVFLGEWMRTGDTYVRNADGTYTCLGRFNDMIKAGGIWVTPSEVEDRLLEHPDVAEAVVVGVPDSDELDKPVACVVPMPGKHVDEADLIRWCREELASFKRPRVVVELAELPKTATGKIRRNVLRDMVKATSEPDPDTQPAEAAP